MGEHSFEPKRSSKLFGGFGRPFQFQFHLDFEHRFIRREAKPKSESGLCHVIIGFQIVFLVLVVKWTVLAREILNFDKRELK